MKIKTIHSNDELKVELARNKNTYLLLYKKDSANSTCAKQNIENIELQSCGCRYPYTYAYNLEILAAKLGSFRRRLAKAMYF